MCLLYFQEEVDKHYAELTVQNLEASEEKCQKILHDLYREMEKHVQNRDFTKPGGYKLYCTHRDNLITLYHREPNKGIQVSSADSTDRQQNRDTLST